MRLLKQILTNNECYKVGKQITVKGVMWHSTGANNPKLSRYVQPDDGILGDNPNDNDWNQHRPDGRQVCVHAFIGKDKNGAVATYQTLPWTMRGWHCGGSGNNTHIGFEICEDALNDSDYFSKVYKEACELTAYLCKVFGLDPLGDGVVTCHSEGHQRGIASNHADVMHWFKRFGKTMDDVRNDVKELMTTVGLTPLVDNAEATIYQMQSYIKSVNPAVPQSVIDMIPYYISEGRAEGIRGDIAFAQSCLETGNFTFKGSAVTLDQNNFCGMGVTSNGMKGNRFATPQLGIRAQIQHLKAYATSDALVNECIDPRYKYVQKGVAPYVEWLGIQENPSGKGWAAGKAYGQKILSIFANILRQPVEDVPVQTDVWYKVQCGAFRDKAKAEQRVAELKAAGFNSFIFIVED